MAKCVWGQQANKSAPIPADHSTWGILEGLLLTLRVPTDVCVVDVMAKNAGVVLSEFQGRADQYML